MLKQTLKPIEFADYLLELSALDERQLLDALAEHWLTRVPLAETIARCGYLAPEEIARLASQFENLEVVFA